MLARGRWSLQAQAFAHLGQQQLAQGLQAGVTFVLQQLAEAVGAGQLQRLFEAEQGVVAGATVQ
ncbi:hypothetical protein D3C81_1664060 [compost metagenome]